MTIHPAKETAFWPLHQDSPIGSQLIAGRTLVYFQQQRDKGIENAQQL